MGMWNITIQGTGAHHNHDYAGDANKMAEAFVKELTLRGHSIESATFTHGGRDNINLTPEPANPSGDAQPTGSQATA